MFPAQVPKGATPPVYVCTTAGDEAESGNVAGGSEPAAGKLHPTRASLQHANRRAGG